MASRYEFWEDNSGKLIPYPMRRVIDHATDPGDDGHQLTFQDATNRLNEQERIIAALRERLIAALDAEGHTEVTFIPGEGTEYRTPVLVANVDALIQFARNGSPHVE